MFMKRRLHQSSLMKAPLHEHEVEGPPLSLMTDEGGPYFNLDY
jgi:hypothetical protein